MLSLMRCSGHGFNRKNRDITNTDGALSQKSKELVGEHECVGSSWGGGLSCKEAKTEDEVWTP